MLLYIVWSKIHHFVISIPFRYQHLSFQQKSFQISDTEAQLTFDQSRDCDRSINHAAFHSKVLIVQSKQACTQLQYYYHQQTSLTRLLLIQAWREGESNEFVLSPLYCLLGEGSCTDVLMHVALFLAYAHQSVTLPIVRQTMKWQ